MKTREEYNKEITRQFAKINKALAELKKLYNEEDISLTEMRTIVEEARLLNTVDFVKKIVD